ncbi:TIGR02186 family protein [Falsiroseomonas sp. CW058]|uniref:TIGR02186 family protein n=1 Tax=Falsiroseomonas sp. CW058 TaxID=3388664 RepID=UPI003D31FE93
MTAGGRRSLPGLAALLAALAGFAAPAPAQQVAPPPLAADLSVRRIEVTTAFAGGEILVFGATERLIHEGGDQVVVLASGPMTSMVVREKVERLGFWINGPAARFNRVPSYWALAGTRPVTEMLDATDRTDLRLGLDLLPLVQLGAQGARFRGALAGGKQNAGLWVDQVRPVEVSGGRLFHARLPVPATVATGEYRVQVMLVRDRRVVARQELSLAVVRTGSAAWIADIARGQPVLYGIACILLAGFAGWLGSVLFRRG